jgi:hypothetical protein
MAEDRKVSFRNIVEASAPVVKAGEIHAVLVDSDVYSTHVTKAEAEEMAADCAREFPGSTIEIARGVAKDDADQDQDGDESTDSDQDGDESDAAAKQTAKRGGLFKSIILGDSRVYDLPVQERDRQPRPVDTTEDALGRSYSDEVYSRISGQFSKTDGTVSPIPNAGAGETFEGDTRSTGNAGFRPMGGGEGDDSYVGGRTVLGVGHAGANFAGYDLVDDHAEPDTLAAVRVGPNYLPQSDPGISPAAGARFPDAKTSTLKRVEKRKPGLFRNVGGTDISKM